MWLKLRSPCGSRTEGQTKMKAGYRRKRDNFPTFNRYKTGYLFSAFICFHLLSSANRMIVEFFENSPVRITEAEVSWKRARKPDHFWSKRTLLSSAQPLCPHY